MSLIRNGWATVTEATNGSTRLVELPRIGTGFEHYGIGSQQMGRGPRLKLCQRHAPCRKQHLLVGVNHANDDRLLMDIQTDKPRSRSGHATLLYRNQDDTEKMTGVRCSGKNDSFTDPS